MPIDQTDEQDAEERKLLIDSGGRISKCVSSSRAHHIARIEMAQWRNGAGSSYEAWAGLAAGSFGGVPSKPSAIGQHPGENGAKVVLLEDVTVSQRD